MNLVNQYDSVLHSVAEEVPHGEDVSALVDGMFSIMHSRSGVGLAANQVGVLKRVIVLHVSGTKQAIVNPEIVKKHPRTTFNEEGCLSYPGRKALMQRHKTVTVKGFDEKWFPVRISASGLLAYCIQHEVDHLNGETILRARLGNG